MTKVMVLIPTFNEAENLEKMVQTVLSLPIDGLEIMILDDNSPDGTGAIADALAAAQPGRVHPVHRPRKEGLGRAYVDGFARALAAGADLIAQMDCDFSHPPEKLPEMVARALEPGHDVVVGSRYAPGGTLDTAWGWHRKLLSWWANRVYVRLILGEKLRDATGGFRLWRREVLQGMDLDRIRSNGYVFQVETIYVAEKLGYKVDEIPIYFADRRQGQSKMSFKIQLEAALRVWQVWLRHRHLTPSMRLPVPDQQPVA